MPIFEYRCSSCAHLEEVLQKHSDPAPGTCPKCGLAGTLARELSLSAFHLKGGGWYKDLYSSASGSTPATSADTSGATSAPAGDAAKKDTTPKGTDGGSGSSGSSTAPSTPSTSTSSPPASGGGGKASASTAVAST